MLQYYLDDVKLIQAKDNTLNRNIMSLSSTLLGKRKSLAENTDSEVCIVTFSAIISSLNTT